MISLAGDGEDYFVTLSDRSLIITLLCKQQNQHSNKRLCNNLTVWDIGKNRKRGRKINMFRDVYFHKQQKSTQIRNEAKICISYKMSLAVFAHTCYKVKLFQLLSQCLVIKVQKEPPRRRISPS